MKHGAERESKNLIHSWRWWHLWIISIELCYLQSSLIGAESRTFQSSENSRPTLIVLCEQNEFKPVQVTHCSRSDLLRSYGWAKTKFEPEAIVTEKGPFNVLLISTKSTHYAMTDFVQDFTRMRMEGKEIRVPLDNDNKEPLPINEKPFSREKIENLINKSDKNLHLLLGAKDKSLYKIVLIREFLRAAEIALAAQPHRTEVSHLSPVGTHRDLYPIKE